MAKQREANHEESQFSHCDWDQAGVMGAEKVSKVGEYPLALHADWRVEEEIHGHARGDHR